MLMRPADFSASTPYSAWTDPLYFSVFFRSAIGSHLCRHGHIICIRVKATAVARRYVLILPVFFGDHSLRHREQRFGFIGFRRFQRGIADLVVSIILERNSRARRIQTERIFTDFAHRWIVADQWPIPAGNSEVLLLHAEPHVDAMSNAMTVGKDERRPIISLRFAKRLQCLLRVGSHGDLRNIDVAIGNGLQRQILARDTLTSS